MANLLGTDRIHSESKRCYRFADGLTLVCATDMAPRLKTQFFSQLSRTISRAEAAQRLRATRGGALVEVEAPRCAEVSARGYRAVRNGERTDRLDF